MYDNSPDPSLKLRGLLNELNSIYSPMDLDIRADNAWGVAVRFFQLIEKMIPEPEEQRRLMSAWFKAVRDRDFKKFRRAIRRYDKAKNGETIEGDDLE